MRDFREIKVWDKSHLLTLAIYQATAQFPREEIYGVTSQMRRSCASIPANIAEGFGRGSNAELARFLQIAMGSACEVEYHILLAKDLNLLSKKIYEDLNERIVEIKRMLASLLMKVRRDR
ncbi:MAG TPA: four helix bundle protein [Pyrinomonadaceae bacterium]|jgi:four helix bundle protein|nr:four helix bundle protein [Pyrinomonadaceae bacterium]